ncbi:sensor histidine kinase [Dyadobacter arcticus]|uniref:histidine kinase n=1 Tax=Dyadobacter arcticus TaxID=1078754 RepID=A0ABX0UX54_9BACT|nr:ATP-binding protein [Dyadobacter arcticus]NIJ55521.1 signal transduction histidine kinase [Dyadobacter arcticus]
MSLRPEMSGPHFARLILLCLFVLVTNPVSSETYTPQQGRAAWKELKKKPVTEESFREVCDLIQDIGKNNLDISYEILAEYLATIQKLGDKRKAHIILMSWAKAKESLHFFEEAEKLYAKARANAKGTGQMYRETLALTVLLYGEWSNSDSSKKYVALGERECLLAKDKENLSFIYTFKALSNPADTSFMHQYLNRAIALGAGLKDKNALFTARYNYANIFLQYNPQKQVVEFESLLELAQDSSLYRFPRKLYERTAFTFRNPRPSVYYQLMQLNLLLTDFESAGKFAELFYNVSIKPNPNAAQAAYFNAEMSLVKSCQQDYATAAEFLDRSRKQFNLPEDKIPYVSYFIAAGLLAEHRKEYAKAEEYFKKFASADGYSKGFHVLPLELYYAHILTLNKKYDQAEKIFNFFSGALVNKKYSATGYYYNYFKAEFLKAKGDYPGYMQSLETFYAIKDSLTNLNKYRAIQEVLAKVRIKDKEQQITKLNEESAYRDREIRKERIFYSVVIGLSVLAIGLLILNSRNRMIRNRQKEALQQSEMERMDKQRHIDLMEGVMEAGEKERRKIADQLHDEVSSMLALASLSVSSTLEKGRSDEQGEQKLHKTQEILSSVSSTIRDLSHQLNPLVIERYGFRKAVLDSAEIINLSGKITLETVVVGFEDTGSYNLPFLNDLYRIIQELLHNVLKHAEATEASLEVIEHTDMVSIIVEDNGVGLRDLSHVDGQGLSTIRSRVAYLNGKMEISNKQDGGVLVVIEIYLVK